MCRKPYAISRWLTKEPEGSKRAQTPKVIPSRVCGLIQDPSGNTPAVSSGSKYPAPVIRRYCETALKLVSLARHACRPCPCRSTPDARGRWPSRRGGRPRGLRARHRRKAHRRQGFKRQDAHHRLPRRQPRLHHALPPRSCATSATGATPSSARTRSQAKCWVVSSIGPAWFAASSAGTTLAAGAMTSRSAESRTRGALRRSDYHLPAISFCIVISPWPLSTLNYETPSLPASHAHAE
jgi:hypothetical protein